MDSVGKRHPGYPRVAVVGGGIGGLATAAFLHRAGIDVTVYEQAPALTEVGADLVVSPNAVRLLRSLGRLDRLRERAVPLEAGWEFRRWADGRVLFSQELGGEMRATLRRAVPCRSSRRSPRRGEGSGSRVVDSAGGSFRPSAPAGRGCRADVRRRFT